jgi:hypothetical protein
VRCQLLEPQVKPAPEGVVVAAKHNTCKQHSNARKEIMWFGLSHVTGNHTLCRTCSFSLAGDLREASGQERCHNGPVAGI